MLCPNFLSLMCTHASTQEVQALLDKGVGPDDHKDTVSTCAVTGSVSVHIRLVRVSVSVRVSVRVGVSVRVRVRVRGRVRVSVKVSVRVRVSVTSTSKLIARGNYGEGCLYLQQPR